MSKSGERKKQRGGELFSARFFLWRGLTLIAVFVIAHLFGLREYTTFISGTTESVSTGIQTSAFLGTAYIVLYLGCVVVAPILILAAALLMLWQTFVTGRKPNET